MNLLTRTAALALLAAPAAVWAQATTRYQRPARGHGSRHESRPKRRRQRLDAGLRRPGADDDRSRSGPLLWRPGTPQERPRHHDAQLHPHGRRHHHLGRRGLQPGVRRIFPLHRQFPVRLPQRRRRHAQRRLRRHHSAGHLHGLPVDVRHHHAGAHLRSLRGTHEVQRHAAVHRPVDLHRLLPDGAHGLGQGRPAQRLLRRQRFPASISPAAPSSTSPAASPPWSAPLPGQTRRLPLERHEAAQSGDQHDRRGTALGGLVRLQRRQRAGRQQPGHQRLRRHPLRRGRRHPRLDGRGMAATPASPACWAPSPVASPDWSRSPPPPASSSLSPPC